MHKNTLFLLKYCRNCSALCPQTPSLQRLGSWGSALRPPPSPFPLRNSGYATGRESRFFWKKQRNLVAKEAMKEVLSPLLVVN